MRQSDFPEWAQRIKEQHKGTQLRMVGNNIYLYAVASSRQPGQEHPAVRQRYLGIVTPGGLIESRSFQFRPMETIALTLGSLPEIIPDSFSPDEWETIQSICLIRNGDSWFFAKLTSSQEQILRRKSLISSAGTLQV